MPATPRAPLELLTTSDIADELGVTRRRAMQLTRDRADFPAPYAVTGAGLRLWRREQIARYRASSTRTRWQPWNGPDYETAQSQT